MKSLQPTPAASPTSLQFVKPVGAHRGQNINRRRFLGNTAAGTAGFLILRHAPSAWSAAANEELNVALIGVGGRGRWFVETMPGLGTNVVALCDVNEDRAADSFSRIPDAPRFHDFRVMLDKIDKQIDAMVIATPDHIHAPAAAAAMKRGKHVYCEKPLTNTVRESRVLREVAATCKVATQMGNQGTASPAYREAVEIIHRGLLGEIREVYAWHDGGGPGHRDRPKEAQAVPETLKWDLWLGPATYRPFHRAWLNWHGWREFGTGNLGNWAPHILNLAFRALKLDSLWATTVPGAKVSDLHRSVRVEAEVSEIDHDSVPRWEQVRYDFPERDGLPPVRIHWCNGSRGGFRPRIEDLLGRKLDWGDAGAKKWADFAGLLIVGAKGKLHANAHNTVYALLPEDQFKGFLPPTPMLPRSPGHEREWLDACKGGPRAMSNFDYAGPLAEFCLLGNVATRFPGPLEFDPVRCAITNDEKAHGALQREYRTGWSL